MKVTLLWAAALLTLAGCQSQLLRERSNSYLSQCERLHSPAEVQLGLVRQMLEQKRAYAGLAHLSALDPAVQASPQALYLNAELLRQTGRGRQAEDIYRQLLNTCLSGYGHYGLGLLLSERDLDTSVKELRRAVALVPTDSRIRNDLGYALLLSKDNDSARSEFMTAIELGDQQRRAAPNLLLLMLVEGDENGAQRLAGHLDVSVSELEELRRRARDIQANTRAEERI